MKAPTVEQVAAAVLYEGYLLYPYRASALKNRQRWNFGVIYPQAYSEAQSGVDPCRMQTECLVRGAAAEVAVKVRCLRQVERTVGHSAGTEFQAVQVLEVDGRSYESRQEAAECEMSLGPLSCAAPDTVRRRFHFQESHSCEVLRDREGSAAGAMMDRQEPLDCRIEAASEPVGDGLFRVTVRISNLTPLDPGAAESRERALARSLLSAHTILRVEGGEFVSLLETPEEFAAAAAACRNVGTWPVLAGESGCRDTLLSSPIILYDYPQVSPESPGDLFDGAEIDEILSLRILTLTDEEKDAIRRGDERARQILERTESLSPEHFQKLHGVLRGAGEETR